MRITLVPAHQVPQVFARRIKNRRPGESVFVTSMSAQFDNNPIIQNLMEYGSTDDSLVIDYFGHWHGVTPTVFMKNRHKKARTLFQKHFPGSYVVMGPPPRINLTNSTILNRSHVKAYAVGKRILSLGGVNCTSYSYYNFIDLMLDFESDEFLSYLYKFSEKGGDLRTSGVGESFWLDSHNKVLVDYGRRNNFYGGNSRSIILNSLLNDLERELFSVRMSSTYIPYGHLDNTLFRHSRQGKSITFYTNRPSKFYPPQTSLTEKFLQTTYALKAKTPWVDRRSDKFNHLKAAIITYPAGDRVAYIGSHNFHELPVWAGTAEICLRTTDGSLIDQLEAFMIDNLEQSAAQETVGPKLVYTRA